MTVDEAFLYTNIADPIHQEVVDTLKAEVRRLKTRNKHWPVTASGTPAHQGMELWHPKWGHGKVQMTVRGESWFTEKGVTPLAAAVSTCYDTPKEAEENK